LQQSPRWRYQGTVVWLHCGPLSGQWTVTIRRWAWSLVPSYSIFPCSVATSARPGYCPGRRSLGGGTGQNHGLGAASWGHQER
jgi:hypothetical protein